MDSTARFCGAIAAVLAGCMSAPSGPAVPDGYRWEELSLPPDSDLLRWGFMVADRGDGTSVVFGGTTMEALADGANYFDDAWLVDGRGDLPTFTRLDTQGAPGPRYCGCAAYDRGRDLVVVVGGRYLEMLSPETWTLDMRTKTWTRLDVQTPPGVLACAMAYSSERQALYLFGGLGGMEGDDDVDDGTYRLDMDGPAWTKLDVGTAPSARFSSIFTDVAPGEPLLLFGGTPRAFGVHYLADVWRFDTASETWSQTQVDGPSPAGRREGWLRVEPGGAGFLVGMGSAGVQPYNVLSDLWRFDFATRTFTDVTPPQSPSPRGFTLHIPASGGQAGILLGGYDNLRPVPGLYRLLPPADDTRW